MMGPVRRTSPTRLSAEGIPTSPYWGASAGRGEMEALKAGLADLEGVIISTRARDRPRGARSSARPSSHARDLKRGLEVAYEQLARAMPTGQEDLT